MRPKKKLKFQEESSFVLSGMNSYDSESRRILRIFQDPHQLRITADARTLKIRKISTEFDSWFGR